ncbi:MAG: BatA domain-containing protein [Candidatus Methanoperedens sp.]|nr:BatA domain-containing protein [Candidatus Methanoperedens sp.]
MLENPSSLVLLLLLVPVIILYLLKPKPKILKMPSIMLLISAGKKRDLRSFFKTLIRDPLLLIQLAAITIIVFSLVNPYFSTNMPYSSTVIVLDNSASMSSTDVSPDRFSQAVDIASGYIKDGKTSLILAGGTPLLLFKDADIQKAIPELRAQRASSTGTDLSDAMLLAAELAGKDGSKIVVISDFSGQDITFAKKMLEAKSIPVDYRQVGAARSNIGIIDALVSENSIKFTVKNYDASEKDITVGLDGGISQTRSIKPGSKEYFSIPVRPGKNTISLEPHDDLHADNVLYISMPVISKKRVLILSDIIETAPVSIAFNSIPGVEVEDTTFVRAPRKPDHNIVVHHNYTRDSLLPGTMDDLRSFVEGGGTLVFEAEDDLAFMDTKGLLPVNVSGRAKPSGFEVESSDMTNGLDLGVSAYLKATLKDGAVALASAPEGPVLAYWNIGRGRVVYLGMNDRWGDFHLQASYPIFWYRLLESSFPAASELNFKTGTVMPLGTAKTVAAPRATIETSDLYLGDAGFYVMGDRTIAANLLDEKESDISVRKIDNTESGNTDPDNTKSEKTFGTKVEKVHLVVLFSIIAIILLALELYYLKHRGDI